MSRPGHHQGKLAARRGRHHLPRVGLEDRLGGDVRAAAGEACEVDLESVSRSFTREEEGVGCEGERAKSAESVVG